MQAEQLGLGGWWLKCAEATDAILYATGETGGKLSKVNLDQDPAFLPMSVIKYIVF